jgi:hypothetical protein
MERFRLHNEIAKLARNQLDPNLAAFRKTAQKTIKAKYPLYWLPLHYICYFLFAVIAIIGAIATWKIYCPLT